MIVSDVCYIIGYIAAVYSVENRVINMLPKRVAGYIQSTMGATNSE